MTAGGVSESCPSFSAEKGAGHSRKCQFGSRWPPPRRGLASGACCCGTTRACFLGWRDSRSCQSPLGAPRSTRGLGFGDCVAACCSSAAFFESPTLLSLLTKSADSEHPNFPRVRSRNSRISRASTCCFSSNNCRRFCRTLSPRSTNRRCQSPVLPPADCGVESPDQLAPSLLPARGEAPITPYLADADTVNCATGNILFPVLLNHLPQVRAAN